MKCKKCGFEWLENSTTKKLKECPVCGECIEDKEKKPKITDIVTLQDALFEIIRLKGESVIPDKKLIISMLLDIAPKLKVEIKQLHIIVSNTDTWEKLYKNKDKSVGEQKKAIAQCLRTIVEVLGMQEEIALRQLNTIAQFFTYNHDCFLEKQSVKRNEKVPDNNDITYEDEDFNELLQELIRAGEEQESLNKAGIKDEPLDEELVETWTKKGNYAFNNQDYPEAVKWYQKAADQGNVEARVCLGVCYQHGLGVKKNDTEAAKWYERAIEEQENINLADCHSYRLKVLNSLNVTNEPIKVGRNDPCPCGSGIKFKDCCGKLKDEPVDDGLLEEWTQNGNYAFNNQDYPEAVKWYQKAADHGNAQAQCNLGVCYQNGLGIKENDTEAVKWYQKAAVKNNAQAQCNLGVCYQNGVGIKKDDAEAAKWYQKAADQGNANAQSNLGLCYDQGIGIKKDSIEAVRWYQKAADQGDANGQYALGLCYFSGRGIKRDREEAIKWLRKAAIQGLKEAKELVNIFNHNY